VVVRSPPPPLDGRPIAEEILVFKVLIQRIRIDFDELCVITNLYKQAKQELSCFPQRNVARRIFTSDCFMNLKATYSYKMFMLDDSVIECLNFQIQGAKPIGHQNQKTFTLRKRDS